MLQRTRNWLARGMAGMAKAMSLSAAAQAFLRGVDVGGEGADINAPGNPYRQVLWTYKCINALARTMAGIPLYQAPADEVAALSVAEKSHRLRISRCARRPDVSRCIPTAIGSEGGRLAASAMRPFLGSRSCLVGKVADDQLLTAGPTVDLFERPNGYHDSLYSLVYATVGYLFARGSVAWILDEMTGNRPGAIHVIDGKTVSPVWAYDARRIPTLLGYKYKPPKTGQTIPLAADEVKYWALWDDGEDPLGGMAPSLPGKLAMASDYNASLFNASALANGCDMGTAFSVPGTLTDPQREQFEQALRRRRSGAAKARRPIVIEGGMTVSNTAFTPREMEFSTLKGMTRLEICALYDVPAAVAGFVDAAGDSSAYTENSLKQFYTQAIFPISDSLLPAIQEIVSRFDSRIVCWWYLEDQPVVQQMRQSRIDSAVKLFGMGYPANQINDRLDLGLADVQWGDTGFLPVSLAPAAELAAGGIPADMDYPEGAPESSDDLGQDENGKNATENTEDAEDDERPRIDAKTAESIWKRFMRSWNPLARSMRNTLRSRYQMQQRKVIAAIRRNVPEKPSDESRSDLDRHRDESRDVLRKDDVLIARILIDAGIRPGEDGAFTARAKSFVTDAKELGLRQSLIEAGITGERLDEALKRLMQLPSITHAIKSESIVLSTKIDAYTRKVLRNNLRTGMEAGEDVRHLADRVQAVMGNRRRAAMTVARNAVGQSLSDARHVGARQAGMTHKGWMHSRGPGERRPGHVAAERAYLKNPIPIDAMFLVDGEHLLYPRDHSNGSRRNTINCQCMQISSRPRKGQRAADAHRDAVRAVAVGGFETHADMLAARRERTEP